MNIMQISFTPFINSAGGTEKVFCDLANYFCLENRVINVFCEGKKGKQAYFLDERVKLVDLLDEELTFSLILKVKHEIARLLKKIGFRNRQLPKVSFKFCLVREKLREIIVQHSPDVIICYQSYTVNLLDSIGYPLDKVIVMFHTFPKVQDLTNDERVLLKRVRYIQVLTQEAKKKLLKLGNENIVVIGNALNRSCVEVEELIPKKREKIIVCVGRLDKKEKRQHLLIKAFAKIANRHKDWKLHLYGGSANPVGYKQYLEKLINENNLKNRIYMLGISKDVQRDIRKASIFVMPSPSEGLGLTIIEAMQLGIPCIGYQSSPAVNEIIVNNINGLLCADGIDPLAEAMEKLICDSNLRTTLAENAMITAKEFDASRIYKKWDCLLSQT